MTETAEEMAYRVGLLPITDMIKGRSSDLTPITPEEREANKAFALAKQKRIAKAESWLRSNGVQMAGRGRWDADDPWALRTLADNLVEAIEKGKI